MVRRSTLAIGLILVVLLSLSLFGVFFTLYKKPAASAMTRVLPEALVENQDGRVGTDQAHGHSRDNPLICALDMLEKYNFFKTQSPFYLWLIGKTDRKAIPSNQVCLFHQVENSTIDWKQASFKDIKIYGSLLRCAQTCMFLLGCHRFEHYPDLTVCRLEVPDGTMYSTRQRYRYALKGRIGQTFAQECELLVTQHFNCSYKVYRYSHLHESEAPPLHHIYRPTTLAECRAACLGLNPENKGRCKSFDYSHEEYTCKLRDVHHYDTPSGLKSSRKYHHMEIYCPGEKHTPDYVKTVVQPDTACPNQWVGFQGTCYRVHHDCAQTWIKAQEICEREGGNLVKLNTKQKETFAIENLPLDTNQQYFTSGYRWDKYDVGLRWRKHSSAEDPTTTVYTNWHHGEPSSYHEKNIMALEFRNGSFWDSGWAWSIVERGVPRPFICEAYNESVLSDCDSSPCLHGGTCKSSRDKKSDKSFGFGNTGDSNGLPDNQYSYHCICQDGYIGQNCEYGTDVGWSRLNHHEYQVFSQCGMQRKDAAKVCRDLNGFLVTIHSKEELNFVGQLVYAGHTAIVSWWIGASLQHDNGDSDWIWTENDTVIPVNYAAWLSWGPKGKFGMLRVDDWRLYYMHDTDNEHFHPFICKRYNNTASDTFTGCKSNDHGDEYTGHKAFTKLGLTCQRWDAQFPHQHTFYNPKAFPDGSVEIASNYCRRPDKESLGPWCYTTDPNTRWQYCDIPLCYPQMSIYNDNCRTTTLGKEYTGITHTTIGNHTCQRWDHESPHTHSRNNSGQFPDATLADAANYCRNPDNDGGGPWCYTTEPDIRWEYCKIPFCGENEDTGCRITKMGMEYRGHKAITQTGLTCQHWDSQFPHKHEIWTFTNESLQDAANYCRNTWNLYKMHGPWCFTTDPEVIWQYCDIPFCEPKKAPTLSVFTCYDDREYGYMGTASVTESGYTCQRWDTQIPHKHDFSDRSFFPDKMVADASNYCRQIYYSPPRCFTTNPHVRLEFCRVKKCGYDMVGCLTNQFGENYTGQQSVTDGGMTCQRWDSKHPHEHDYTDPAAFPDSTLQEAANFCRNPDGKLLQPWCYTTDPNITWQYCNISLCDEFEDTEASGEESGELSGESSGEEESICLLGWEEYDRHCYFFVSRMKLTWQDAKSNCQFLRTNAHLVTIDSRSELAFLHSRIKEKLSKWNYYHYEEWWTSGCKDLNSGRYFWDDGSNGGYGRSVADWLWSPGSPRNETYDLNSFIQLRHYDKVWRIENSLSDHDDQRSICEYDPAAPNVPSPNTTTTTTTTTPYPVVPCPGHWIGYQDNCYHLYDNCTKTRTKAQQICDQQGGYLISFESKDEETFVINELNLNHSMAWYTGGKKDNGHDATWYWDKTYLGKSDIEYEAWHRGEPSADSWSTNVVILSYKDSTWGWSDGDDSEQRSFICEAPSHLVSQTCRNNPCQNNGICGLALGPGQSLDLPGQEDPLEIQCPDLDQCTCSKSFVGSLCEYGTGTEWHRYGSYEYHVFGKNRKRLHEAAQVCNLFGSYLVSFHSPSELRFVGSFLRSMSSEYMYGWWTGGKIVPDTCGQIWVWEELGQEVPMLFSIWEGEEPLSWSKQETFIKLYYMKYDEPHFKLFPANSQEKLSFICKRLAKE